MCTIICISIINTTIEIHITGDSCCFAGGATANSRHSFHKACSRARPLFLPFLLHHQTQKSNTDITNITNNPNPSDKHKTKAKGSLLQLLHQPNIIHLSSHSRRFAICISQLFRCFHITTSTCLIPSTITGCFLPSRRTPPPRTLLH